MKQHTLQKIDSEKWFAIVKEFQKRFVRGVGPGWAGTEPTDAESWVEADEEMLLDFIHETLAQAIQEAVSARDELWKKRILYILFQEGSLKRADAELVVTNLSNGKVDNLLEYLSQSEGVAPKKGSDEPVANSQTSQ